MESGRRYKKSSSPSTSTKIESHDFVPFFRGTCSVYSLKKESLSVYFSEQDKDVGTVCASAFSVHVMGCVTSCVCLYTLIRLFYVCGCVSDRNSGSVSLLVGCMNVKLPQTFLHLATELGNS